MTAALCENCGAQIVWAWTEATEEHPSRRMPLDPRRYPREDTTANVAVRTDHTGRLWARVLRHDRPLAPFEHRRMPHFATCTARPARDELAARRRRRGRHPRSTR